MLSNKILKAKETINNLSEKERVLFLKSLNEGESEAVPYATYNKISRENDMCPLSAYIAMKLEGK